MRCHAHSMGSPGSGDGWRESSRSATTANCVEIAFGWRKSTRSNSTANCVEIAFGWRKSSRSNSSANCVEVGWRKSSRSASTANCVEVAADGPVVAVRDSKSPDAGLLVFAAHHWIRFLASLRT